MTTVVANSTSGDEIVETAQPRRDRAQSALMRLNF
jgi:hypothetical protein